MTTSPSLKDETLRLYHRYQAEVVERFNLCPWAKAARLSGNAVALVCSVDTTSLLTVLDDAALLDSDIVLLIFPDYRGSRAAFEQLVADLIRQDGLRCELTSPVFAMAAFHPEASVRTAQALDLVPYLRSTPDPTIQLVRVSALERARKNEPAGTQFVDPTQLDLAQLFKDLQTAAKSAPSASGVDNSSLRQRIADANLTTWHNDGHLLQQCVQSILADRRDVHARFGLAPCAWELDRAFAGAQP